MFISEKMATRITSGFCEWPFDWWRIGFLTTETLTTRVVQEVHKRRKRRLVSTEVPDLPALYPIKVPVFIDARARANYAEKQGVVELASEIIEFNPNAVVIANGAKPNLEHGQVNGEKDNLKRIQTFQGCKGKNDLHDKDIYIVLTHLAPDQYAELNVIGQWLGISNIIELFYMDQINQAVGRNSGFRQSNERQTKTFIITSNRLYNSVISNCCSADGSRTGLYKTYTRPW